MARYGRALRAHAKVFNPTEGLIDGNLITIDVQSMEFGVAGWSTSTGSTAIAQSSAVGGYYGQYAARLTMAASAGSTAFLSASQFVISASTSYTYTMYVYPVKAVTFWLQMDWRTSGGTFISSSGLADVTLVANQWNQVTLTATSPGTAGKVTLLGGEGSSGVTHFTAGDFCYLDHASLILAVGGGSVNANAETTSQTATANQPTVAITANSGTVAASSVSNAPTPAVSANAGAVSVSATTNSPTPAVGGKPGTVTAPATAYDVVDLRTVGAGAETATAYAPTVAVKNSTGFMFGALSPAATVSAPTPAVAANAGAVAVTATVYQPSISGNVIGSAGLASVTATANAPTAANKPVITAISGTTVTNSPTASNKPVIGSIDVAADVAEKKPYGVADEDWQIIFEDNFSGNTLDTSVWQTGWFGSGLTDPVNPSIEHVAYDPAQVTISGGNLNIAIKSQSTTIGAHTYPYRSGIITTNPYDGRSSGGFEFTYGYAEARMYFPNNGSGVIANWPAWWITGQSWPTTGEIDIIEGLGGSAAAHFHSSGGDHGGTISGDYTGWHVFGVRWAGDSIKWYWDGTLVQTVTVDLTNSPLYLVLDYSADGTQDNVPNTMLVDYVRVWQLNVGPKVTANAGTVTASAVANNVVDLRTVGASAETATAYQPSIVTTASAGTVTAATVTNSPTAANKPVVSAISAATVANAPIAANKPAISAITGTTVTNSPTSTASSNAQAGHAAVTATAYSLLQDVSRTTDAPVAGEVTFGAQGVTTFSTETTSQTATANQPAGKTKPNAGTGSASASAFAAMVSIGMKPAVITPAVLLDTPFFDTNVPTGKLIISPENRNYVIDGESRVKLVSRA